MKNKKDSNVLTRLLPDNIPDKDAFGGHDRVARSIYELINEEEGGKAIALSGSFGSGKSAVVGFLKRFFEGNKKKDKVDTKIFVFDAWEHQGNSLRRAFLEEYIDFLRNDEVIWSGNNEWEKELDIVSRHREEIETKSEPKITTLGGWFALSLLLLPLGLASVRLGIVDPPVMWLINVGFALLFLPTLILLGIYISWRPFLPRYWDEIKEEYNLEDFKFLGLEFFKYIGYFLYHHRPDHHKRSIFNFLVKESTEEIETTSLKSPDPTTIEFQKLFGRITKRVLKNENRRLIIVIDNIDRLTTESSINAWTTLRAFFENENKSKDWNHQFWLIAPFDFKSLKKLWGGLDHLDSSEKDGKPENPSDYVQAFIDKTFQVVFRVPPPVLSDWKDYFIHQLRNAFPHIQEEDHNLFKDIATLYQLKGIEKNESPTPRDIKQFINRLSALYRIWHKEDIKLPTLAYYELIADREEKFVEKLKENKLVDATSRYLIDEKELNRKLVAVHFNCEIDRAYQVLYGNQIGNALHEGTAKDLTDYFETDGFIEVLTSEFYPRLGQNSLILANCALCLKEIEEKSNDHNLQDFFESLATSFKRVESIKPASENIGRGISSIWEKTGFDESWITSILGNISYKEAENKETTIESWYSAMEPIFESLQDHSVLHLLKDNLIIPSGADEYIRIFSLINNSETILKDEITKHLQPNAEPDQIVTAYSNTLKSDKIPVDLGEVLYMQSLAKDELGGEKWKWDKLIGEIKNVIKVSGSNRPYQIESAIKMMLMLCFKFKDKSAIDQSKDPNFKNGLFFLINNQSDEKLLALLVLSSVLFNPDSQITGNDINTKRGLNALKNIISSPNDNESIQDYFLNYLLEFYFIEDFFEVQHGNNKLQSISKFIIKNIFKSEESLEFINANIVFKYFDEFYQAVDQEPLTDHISDLYKREENLVDRVIEQFKTDSSNYQLHYYFAKACPEEFRESYFEFLAEGFINLEKEEWLKHLTEETELVELAILIQQSGLDLNLSVKFKDALEEHYRNLYSGEIALPSEDLISRWDYLLGALDADIKSSFLKNIKFYIESNSDGMVSKIGHLYDLFLISEDIYLYEVDRFITNVFTRVLKSNNQEELTWLKELIRKQPEVLEKDKSATKAFEAEIKYINLESYSPEAQSLINEIAKGLKVEFENESKKNKED